MVDYRFANSNFSDLRASLEKEKKLVEKGMNKQKDMLVVGFVKYLLLNSQEKQKEFSVKRGFPKSKRSRLLVSIRDPFITRLNHGYLF